MWLPVLLFILITPGSFFTFSKKSSMGINVFVHAIIFAVVLYLSKKAIHIMTYTEPIHDISNLIYKEGFINGMTRITSMNTAPTMRQAPVRQAPSRT